MKAVAEAPGKAIITGEHFVVHGAWSLAAALQMKVRVEATDSEKLTIDSDRFAAGTPGLKPVRDFVQSLLSEFSWSQRMRLSIKSDLPHGAGLGSSAATMVAVVAAVSRLRGHPFTVEETISRSMVGETDVHGKASGVDPTVCAMGGVVLFRRGSKPRRVVPQHGLSLLVAFTGKSRSTKGQIAKVVAVRNASQGFFDGLAGSISGVSKTAAEELRTGDLIGLGRLLAFNHALLATLGVSSRELDALVEELTSMGCYGAKLTGAGGGGSVVAVAPEGKEKRIISRLKARGIEAYQSHVPAGGVKSWVE
ncbi:MAG: mevalonate kinase [Thaumarchaeota archaeon]|nr:mevalonate kinase [Nitrososphaerota archaeon]